MALFGRRAQREAEQARTELANLREALPAEVLQGIVMESPFTETAPRSRREARREIREAARAAPSPSKAPARAGFAADIPRGGATEYNQGYTQIGGATDRRTLMEQMQQLYVSCIWAGACVDTVSRFCAAAPMSIEPDDESNQRKETIVLPPQAQKAQDLFGYINPEMNFRQLMRTIFTDLQVYGDAFIEVVWLLGEPVALYPLPCPDMLIDADEHGVVNFYVQRTETDRRAQFKPHEIIHIKFDSPRGGLYGLGPTEKSVHAITTWLFAKGLEKAIAEKGNPPNLAVSWDANLAENEIKKHIDQYRTRNLGPANIGTPASFKGDTKVVDLKANQIAEILAMLDKGRDEIFGGYGTPPAIMTAIESGNLGGGTGTSQFKNFKVNTCGPYQELVLEAFTFAILEHGFGVEGYKCAFGEVDWRDDETIEKIAHQRITDGRWTPNRGRDEIGEPPVPGGDEAVIILSRDVVAVADLSAASKATIAKAGGMPAPVPELGADEAPPPAPPAEPYAPPKGAPKGPQEAVDEVSFFEAYLDQRAAERARALR